MALYSSGKIVEERPKKGFFVETEINDLIDEANTMGLTSEIQDNIETLDKCYKSLLLKARELAVIESIAMESTDENIVELRQQLFAVVKIVHSDNITEVMKEINERDSVDYDSIDDGYQTSAGPDRGVIQKYRVIDRLRRYLNRRKEYRMFIKKV